MKDWLLYSNSWSCVAVWVFFLPFVIVYLAIDWHRSRKYSKYSAPASHTPRPSRSPRTRPPRIRSQTGSKHQDQDQSEHIAGLGIKGRNWD